MGGSVFVISKIRTTAENLTDTTVRTDAASSRARAHTYVCVCVCVYAWRDKSRTGDVNDRLSRDAVRRGNEIFAKLRDKS